MSNQTRQGRLSSGHPVTVDDSTTLQSNPVDGFINTGGGNFANSATPNTTPHHIMSPVTQEGISTTGLIIGLATITEAVPTTPDGFGLILWIANPNGYRWYRSTEVWLNINDAAVTYDIDAFPVWVQVDPATVSIAGIISFDFFDV